MNNLVQLRLTALSLLFSDAEMAAYMLGLNLGAILR